MALRNGLRCKALIGSGCRPTESSRGGGSGSGDRRRAVVVARGCVRLGGADQDAVSGQGEDALDDVFAAPRLANASGENDVSSIDSAGLYVERGEEG